MCGVGLGGVLLVCVCVWELVDYCILVLNVVLLSFSDWVDCYGEFCGLVVYFGCESIIS